MLYSLCNSLHSFSQKKASLYLQNIGFVLSPPPLFTLLLGFPEQSHMSVVKIDFYHRLNTVIGPQSKESYLPVPAVSYLLAEFMD